MREVGIAPGWGLYASSGVKKPPILLNGDLGCSYRKGIQPDAMNRAFHRLTGLGSHGEPASGDANSYRLTDQRATSTRVMMGHYGPTGACSI